MSPTAIDAARVIGALKYFKQRILSIQKIHPTLPCDFLAIVEIRKSIEVLYKNGAAVYFSQLNPRDQIELIDTALVRLELEQRERLMDRDW